MKMSDEKSGLSVVIPAYNEEKGIGDVIRKLQNIIGNSGCNYEIIVVDDGSTDKTADIVQETGVRLIQHPFNRGYGAALKTGIRHAQHDIVVITDADGTYPVDAIPSLVERMDKYDMVVGARTGESVKIPFIRQPAKLMLGKIANYLTGTKIPDLNSGLRAFRKNIALKFFNILPSGFSFTTTITLAMLTNDYLVHYIPIDYYKRVGKSKIKPIRDTSRFLSLIFRTVMYFNPLKVFLPISTALFIAALAVFFYSLLFTPKIMDATVTIIIMTAVLVMVIGMLADLIDKRSQRMNSE